MYCLPLTRSLFALFVLAFSLGAQTASPVIYQFSNLLNHDGSKSIADVKGHPLLFVVSKHSSTAMKIAAELSSKHSKKGLIVVLWTEDVAMRPVLEHAKLMRMDSKSRVWLCGADTPPLDLKADGFPRLSLISVTGRALHRNLKTEEQAKVEKAVKKQLKLGKNGWGDHTIAIGIRARAFGAGSFSKGYSYLMGGGSGAPKEVKDAARDMNALFAHRIRQLRWLNDQGRYQDAMSASRSLMKSVRGRKKWEDEVAKTKTELFAGYKKTGLKQEKILLKLIKPLMKAKATSKVVDGLTDFIKNTEDSLLSGRATRWMQLAKAFLEIDQANSAK